MSETHSPMPPFELHDQGMEATSHRFSVHHGGGLPILLDIGMASADRRAERELAERMVAAFNAFGPMLEALRGVIAHPDTPPDNGTEYPRWLRRVYDGVRMAEAVDVSEPMDGISG